MISVEFRDWVNDKILQYLPVDRVKSGNKLMFRCPLCGDSKKNSMKKRGYYYLETCSYYCFNCGESMSGMRLLEHLSGEDYASLKDEYIRMTYDGNHFDSISSDFHIDKTVSGNILKLKNVVKNEWKNPLSEKAKDYLKGRMVLNAPFLKENFYSYYSKKNNDEYILIPWRINGTDCYFQLNDFEKHNKMGMKYIFPKNKDKMLYGLDNIDLKYDFIIITEGVYDSLFLPNCVCCGGRFLTDNQFNIIKRRYPKMRLVMSFDNDKPGLESMYKSLSDKRCRFEYFKWFDDNTKEKDINEYVISHNDVNIFRDKDKVNDMIIDPLMMNLWLKNHGTGV